jgi:hypothetical protein
LSIEIRRERYISAFRSNPRHQEKQRTYASLNTHVKGMQQKAGETMQSNKHSKPVTRLFRVIFGFYLTLVTLYGVLYLLLLALTALMRLKWVSERVRRLSKKANPLTSKFAGTPFGDLYFNLSVLKHIGRSSGREYRTFLSAYPLGDGFVLTLAYGPNVDWCRNILATGTCTLTWRGQEYALEKPEILPISEAWEAYPLFTRLIIRAGGTKQCLWVHRKQEVPAKDVPEQGVVGS